MRNFIKVITRWRRFDSHSRLNVMRGVIFVFNVIFFNFDGPPVHNGRASILSFFPGGIFIQLKSNVWMDDTFIVGSEYSTDSFVVDRF